MRRPKPDGFTGLLDEWLRRDRDDDHRKQRHTVKRIFERLRDEHGFTSGYTIVKDYVREHHRRRREMYMPLVHPPVHGQADFRRKRWSGRPPSHGVTMRQSDPHARCAVRGQEASLDNVSIIGIGGLAGSMVGRLVDGEIDYAAVHVGGGNWVAAAFPDAALVLGRIRAGNNLAPKASFLMANETLRAQGGLPCSRIDRVSRFGAPLGQGLAGIGR